MQREHSGRFSGFSAAGLKFLRGLAKNNDRAWFQPRKHIYEAELLQPLQALVADATRAMRTAKIPLAANPAGSTFRIYRDIRFSRDKRPYKTNLGAYLSLSGEAHAPGGLYVHIQPSNSFMAVAFYQLDKEPLLQWRSAMAQDPKRFQAMLRGLERNGLKLSDESEPLKRMPRGFEAYADSDIAKYFKVGSFIVSERLPDRDVTSNRIIKRMVELAKKSKPLLEYGQSIYR